MAFAGQFAAVRPLPGNLLLCGLSRAVPRKTHKKPLMCVFASKAHGKSPISGIKRTYQYYAYILFDRKHTHI
jgi:hypothetical protein